MKLEFPNTEWYLLSAAAHLGEGLGQIWFPQMKNDNPGFLSVSYQERKCGKIHISICV